MLVASAYCRAGPVPWCMAVFRFAIANCTYSQELIAMSRNGMERPGLQAVTNAAPLYSLCGDSKMHIALLVSSTGHLTSFCISAAAKLGEAAY